MANTNEIKQKIVLEGEKQYTAALKEAQRNLKTLKSELKAETAELGKNATEQQKAATKAQNLKKQIVEQEKVVKTYRAALQEVKEKYGDNEDAVAKWEQKLNDARTTLANLKSDLEDVSGSLDDVGSGMKGISTDAAAATTATKSAADAVSALSSVGESVSGAIESVFTGMISSVERAVTALWDMISETAARANNWTDLGSYYGSSAEEMQKWDHAVTSAGGSFENLIALTNQLAFGGKEKKITEIFGISKENYRNDLEYTRAVVAEMAKQKEAMQAAGTWDDAMSEIFGAKKAQNASWFISNWERVIQEAEDFNPEEGGYGMTGEELSNLNELYIKTKEIETRWISIKDQVAAAFAPRVMDLQTNVLGGLDAIKDFLNAETPEEREAALEKLRENVEEFFKKVGEILKAGIETLNAVGQELQESDDPLTKLIGDILVKVTEALQWMIDNQDAVKTAFESIFGVWLIGKLAAVAGKLASILLQMEAVKTFKGVSALSAAGAAEAGAATGGAWGTAFWAAAAKAVPALAFFYTLLKPASTAGNDWDVLFNEDNGTLTSAGWQDYYTNADTNWKEDLEMVGELFGDLGRITGDENAINAIAKYRMGWNGYSKDDLIAELESLGYIRRDTEEEEKELPDGPRGYIQTTGEVIHKDRRTGRIIPEDEYMFGEVEEVDLTPTYTDADRVFAVQDWWDAWRNAVNGDDTWEEEQSAFEYLQEVFGDDFADTFYNISEHLNELTENDGYPEDLPADWWMDAASWRNAGTANEDGVTSGDINDLKGALGNVSADAKAGVREGIAGLKVTMDGQTVGRIVAPYVSQYIARDIV